MKTNTSRSTRADSGKAHYMKFNSSYYKQQTLLDKRSHMKLSSQFHKKGKYTPKHQNKREGGTRIGTEGPGAGKVVMRPGLFTRIPELGPPRPQETEDRFLSLQGAESWK